MKILKLILSWIRKNAALLGGGIFVFLMIVCFVSGCNYHKNRFKCPEITTDTIYKTDDYWHHIADSLANLPSEEKIKWIPQDTLFTPADTFIKDVDTAAILRDYYSTYRYHWGRLDTGKLKFDLYTTVTENMPVKYELDYKILQPQKIINNIQDNSVHYSKYVYLGIDLPVKNMDFVSIDVLVASKRLLIGGGYVPLQKGVSLKVAIPLLKWE